MHRRRQAAQAVGRTAVGEGMSALVRCAECARFRMGGTDLAAHGMGNCELRPVWEHHSATYANECQHFTPAQEETVKARLDWINNARSKTK